MNYLIEHGYTHLTIYQPAGRFWLFQWIDAGWLLALSRLLIAATIWLVRRRAAVKRCDWLDSVAREAREKLRRRPRSGRPHP